LSIIASTGAYGQISSINSAYIHEGVFNDMPGATRTFNNSYPGSITLSESNVSRTNSGGLNRDVWYFSNNGGASAYQFNAGNYFTASFSVTLSGGTSGVDMEAGFLFSNPAGTWGGDNQVVVVNNGVVAQFGGPSYYPFSPAAGGYPGVGGSVPNYVVGQTYTMTMIYTVDPHTGNNAFEYAVNGQFGASAAGNPYFDLGAGLSIGALGDNLGGYFQIGNAPNNSGSAVFSNISITPIIVPEPSALALAGVGMTLAWLFRRRQTV
jgi:hypothetical protein